MNLLTSTAGAITPPDHQAAAAARRRLNQLYKPSDSLGQLEDMLAQYIGVTGETEPVLPKKCLILACADHGVAEIGVSAYPIETTVQMTKNYLIARGAGANALANHSGSDLVVADLGIATPTDDIPGLLNRKIAFGTNNFTTGPAMTRDQAIQSLETGIELARQKAGEGYRCFSLGEMGIGNTTASAAIAAAFAGLTPIEATGRGTGISDKRLEIKINAVRQALALNRPIAADGIDVLAKVGGFELGALAGIILGAAASRAAIIIDGFNATAAALIAHAIAPLSKHYMMGSHLSAEQAHDKMLAYLALEPCIDMGLRLGEGTGAALAKTLLDAALKLYRSTPAAAPRHHYGQSAAACTDMQAAHTIEAAIAAIKPLDRTAMEKCRLRIDNLTKPLGSLHALERLTVQLAGVAGVARPRSFTKAVVLLAADHGVAAEGIDRRRPSAARLLRDCQRGGAAVNILAEHAGATLLLADWGAAAPLSQPPHIYQAKIAPGTQNIADGAAMTRAQAIQAVTAGIRLAHTLSGRGVRVIGLGGGGAGGDIAAHAVIAALLKRPAWMAAPGKYPPAERMEREAAVIERALRANQPNADDPLDVLAKVGGFETAGLAGFILGAAAQSCAVVLDDIVTGAAALAAVRLAPTAAAYLIGSHQSLHPAHTAALEALGVPAYLRLRLRIGQGAGAALGLTLIDAGLHMLNDMKTFADAAVAIAHDGPGAARQSLAVK